MFSAFSLPLDKRKYFAEFEEFERKVHTLTYSIEVFENMENDIEEFSNLKSEIQKK